MIDNIRITIPMRVSNALKSDKKYFELDSMNDLYSRIIKNYYDSFPINKKRINEISNLLKNKVTQSDLKKLVRDIANIDLQPTRILKNNVTDRISLKVTKATYHIVDQLNDIAIEYSYSSLVSILRDMFTSYSNLRLLDREKIVLKDEIADINYAISKQFEMQINYKDKNMKIYPYILTTPIDDYSQFLIAEDLNSEKIRILKISKIKSAYVNEYKTFSISSQKELLLDEYRKNELTVFNSVFAQNLKKSLEISDGESVLPYLLDEARNYHDDKISLIDKIKS